MAVLCFDQVTFTIMKSLGGEEIYPISIDHFLASNPDYAAVQSNRSKVEFYFTATPVLIRRSFDLFPLANHVTYLDSDLFFFGPPSQVFAEQGSADVSIVPHHFPDRLSHLAECGTYNVGWVSFRRTSSGIGCVEWWMESCLEWCYDYVQGNRYADQGYLDQFPSRFREVFAHTHRGVNLAPWNVERTQLWSENDKLKVAGEPLLFFHFQGIRELIPGWFELGLRNYGVPLTPGVRDLVYLPYLRCLVRHQQQLARQFGVYPQLGYQRLSSNRGSLLRRARQNFMKRVLPHYRRWSGQLVFCTPSSESS
ncbi:MAG TPA: hypothetical protein PLN52_02500 [Opitutaceae bacterium]|nr:hypothetical protein [Opitutaceae bacterium]